MYGWIESLHWSQAILFFWLVGIVRTSVVYLLGWLAASGSGQVEKIRALMSRPLYQRAQKLVNRWGLLAVPACFLTLGFQTAVIITTGFTKMPLHRWIPAMLLGTLIWGAIYGTVGMAVVWAWLERPDVLGPLLIFLVCLALLIFLAHRRKNKKVG